MTFRIAVSSKVEDARARNILQTLKGLFPKAGLRSARAAAAYAIDSNPSRAELDGAAAGFANPIIETYALNDVPTPEDF